MKRRAFLAGAGAALFVAGRAEADDVSDALAAIAKARADLKTLVAPFSQERVIGLLASSVKSEGEMTMVRPDRLRWELKAPDDAVYWIGPEGLSYKTKEGGGSVGKAGAARFGAVLSDLLTLVGGDLERLRARYELSIPSRDGGITLAARPKTEDVKKLVKGLELKLAPDLWSARRVVLEEASGDRSVITFGAAARDVKVDPARMVPPKG